MELLMFIFLTVIPVISDGKYIVFLSLSWFWKQVTSIITSSLNLCKLTISVKVLDTFDWIYVSHDLKNLLPQCFKWVWACLLETLKDNCWFIWQLSAGKNTSEAYSCCVIMHSKISVTQIWWAIHGIFLFSGTSVFVNNKSLKKYIIINKN